MEASSEKAKDLLVFMIRKESQCAECGEELGPGRWITLEKKGALCLSCADLDHLLYLPSGDAALTRRATKHSRLHAKVLRWSRTRKRYERQGILVESAALDKAEEECLSDAEVRERRREREAERRELLDEKYVQDFSKRIRELFPRCPAKTATQIAEHACQKYSKRVGRSAAAKEFDPEAVFLAVRAHIRHAMTRYDELLLKGYDRAFARFKVSARVDEILGEWEQKA